MKLLLIGTHGQKNWGDELLLHVFVYQLNPVIDHFFINSYLPRATKHYLDSYQVTTFHTRKQPFKLVRYMAQCDVMLFAGGSILKELNTAYGSRSYMTLNIINLITGLAHDVFRKPILLAHIGVGPLKTPKGVRLTKNILKRVQRISVRETDSSKLLSELGIRTPHTVVPDAVFSIDRAYLGLSLIREFSKNHEPHSALKLGLNLHRNIANENNWTHFIDNLLDDLVTTSRTMENMEIVGLAMQYNTSDSDDYATLKIFRSKLRKQIPNLHFSIIKPNSLHEIAAAIESVDIFVGERLHALILASIIGVPLVALEYDMKVTGVIHDLGLSEYGVNINKPIQKGSIAAIISEIASHPKEVAARVGAASAHQREKAQQAFGELRRSLHLVSQKRGENNE